MSSEVVVWVDSPRVQARCGEHSIDQVGTPAERRRVRSATAHCIRACGLRPVTRQTSAHVSDGRLSSISTGCSTRAYASNRPRTTDATVPRSPDKRLDDPVTGGYVGNSF
jgi:hypothetical protein